jgi:hypothetical protein
MNAIDTWINSLGSPVKLVAIADNGWGTALLANAASTVGTSEAVFKVGVAATGISVAWNHWYTQVSSQPWTDTDPSGTITFNASLKVISSTNPGTVTGTIYRLTFNGRTTATLDPGGRIVSDLIGITVAQGDVIAVRTYLASGTAYATHKTWGTYASNNGGFTAASDLTAPGSAAISGSNGNYFIPAAILGYPVNAGSAKSVLLIGNSIGSGLGDDGILFTSPNISSGGFALRALTGVAGFVNAGVGGDLASWFQSTSGSFRRLKGVERCNSAIIEYGTNDLVTNSLTSSALETILLNLATNLRRMGIGKICVITLPPRTTSTDSWATTTNQTPLTSESQRVAHNTWVRAGCPVNATSLAPVSVGTPNALTAGQSGHPFTGFFDTAATVESSLNSGLWAPCNRVTTGSITSGQSTITASGANFQNTNQEAGGDIGTAFALAGAGAGGVALIADIASVSNGTTCGINAVASATVTNAQLNIGLMTIDGTHPSSHGHYLMSQAIDPTLL